MKRKIGGKMMEKTQNLIVKTPSCNPVNTAASENSVCFGCSFPNGVSFCAGASGNAVDGFYKILDKAIPYAFLGGIACLGYKAFTFYVSNNSQKKLA